MPFGFSGKVLDRRWSDPT